ncbi:MAG: hypothetical protein WC519_01775 [Parcubacteria group bacterium]
MNWIKKILGGRTDKETLTCSLEQIYDNLKKNNPNKDEHWLLANTWMARYGDLEASKQKGLKLTKYIAYKDTFQFSILDTPKSIRALVLFLIYKELGEKAAESDAEEFAQIMKPLQKFQGGGKLIEEYKHKNPFTWNEIQTEGDESIYGLYGFLNATDYLDKNPEEMERVMKEVENL